MKKRILSLFLVFALCLTLMPSAVFAEAEPNGAVAPNAGGNAVAESGGTEYETLQEILDDASEAEITLLQNVTEDITVCAATTIIMNGHSITGNIDATDSLTLTGGTVNGTVKVDGGVFNMTAPSDAEAAITNGLNVVSGSAYVSGAQIGVKVSLTFGGTDLTISGSDRAVDLLGDPIIGGNATIYGATDENGDATLTAEFNTENYTYTIYDSIVKKISTKQGGGGSTPVSATIELAPDSAEIYGGQSAEFTVSYNGTDALKAYIQKNAQDDTIDAAYDADTGKVTVTTTEEVKAGKYTLYVHEIKDASISASADITVKNAVAKDSNGRYYGDIKTAVEEAADGSTITVIAEGNQLSLPYNIYVAQADKGITLDLNGRSLGGYPINVGGTTITSNPRPGKLTVTDSSCGNGAVGITVRNNGTFILASENENTTLLQMQVYGGYIELYGGKIARDGLNLNNNITLSSLLPADKGLAYRQARGSVWIPLTKTQDKDFQPSYDLVVTQCEHTEIDADSNCLYCGQAQVAEIGGKYYASVKAAVDAANANDTVTLLKNADEAFFIEKDITINLSDSKPMLEGNITIKSGNTLTLKGSGTVSIVQSGYQFGTSGTAAEDLIGGALNVLSDEVFVGYLLIEQRTNPAMHLSRGSFGKIELTDNLKDTMTLSELLAEGHAFAAYGSGKVENGYVQKLNNIKVIEHEHDTSSGPCVCGYTCDHSNGFTDDGKCKDCGYVCTHTNVGDDGKCAVCGTAMVAKVEVGETITYASDLAYALNNAVNGATITLLTDTELSAYVNIYDKTMTSADQMVVTLDLAGHTVTSSKPIVIGADRNITASYYGTLKIVGSGNITLNYAVLNAREKGVLDLSGWEDGAISSVTVTRNGNTNEEGKLIVGENAGHIGSLGFYNWTSTEITNTKLYGGSYGEISTSGSYTVSLAGLLPAGYAFKNTDGSFADATASKLYGVTVSACDHNGANGFDYKANACPYCGAPAVAYTKLKNVEDNPWRNFADLQTAIDADRDGGFVLQLLADVTGDYTIDGTQDTGLDLSGYHINGTLYVKGTKGDFITTTLSNTQNTATVGIDKVVAFDGAELAGSRYPAVIGELTLADGATWENILNLKTLGYKVLNADGSYKWYAPADITDRTTLNNVIINSLPITSKNLSFKVNGKNVTGNKVDRGTTVQLCANCNTSGATVTFYVKGPDDDGYARHMSEYKKIGSTSYYVTEYTFNKTGTYDIYFYASKDGYSVSSADKTLTVSLPNLSKAKITFTNGNESAYEPYNSTTGAPPYTVTYNDKVLTEDVDYTVTGDSSEYDAGRTCTLTITAVDGSGYTGKKTARWKIVPHKVKLSVGDVIKNYDGTTDLPDGKISLVSAGSAFTQPGRGLPLTAGNGYELIDAGYDSANASETEKTVSFTVKLTDKNYTFEDGTKEKNFTLNGAESDDKTFKINPATIDLSKIEFTQIIYNDLAKTYEIDLNPLLAELLKQQKPAGVEYGSIKYQACNYAFNPSDYLDGTTVSVSSDGILSLPIASAHTAAVGTEIGTLDVNVNTTNYGLFQLPIKVKIGEKITPVPAEGFSASATDITYGQTVAASTLTVTGSMKDPRTGETVNGTFEWKDGTVKPNAGSYDAEWTFTPAAGYEEYAQTNGNVTVKVNRKDIAGAIVTLEQDSFVYDGKRKDPVVKSVVLDGVTLAYGKNNDYGCMYNATEKVGTYNDFYINGHGNYTGQISVTWSITAREVTPEIDVASCSYTGDALEPTVTLTDDLGNTIDPSEYSVTYSNNTNAGKGLVSIKDVEGGNYVIKAKSQDFPIDQAAAPEATPGTLNVINGTMLTYTYDFKPLLPELTKGEYGTIRYNLSAVSLVQNSGYYLDQTTVEFDDGVLILASLYAKDGTMTDEIGTVKVNVATDNYRSFELTLTLNAVNQIKPTADGTVTASAITYGQTLSESTISGKMKDPATGETVNGTFAWKNGTAKPNAGNYDAEWTFTPAAGYEKYAAVTDTATVEVNRKDIAGAKVTLKSDSFVYDGTRKIPEAESVVLDGVTLEYGEYKDYVCGYSSGANVATYEFTVIGYNNYIGNVTVNWSITAREVTPTVTVADGEYVYDEGKEIKPNVTVKDGDTVIDPTEYDVSYSNNTNAGTGKVTVTDKDGGNYVIGTADTTFTIKPAKGGSLGTAERSQKYTYTQNFTYTPDDWSKLPKNQTFSYSSTYSVSEGSNAVLTCRDISDDGTLTYAISGGKAGDKVVITLRAHCGNYEDFTVTLNVTLLKRNEQAALVVKGDTTVVYGQTLTLTAEGGSGTGEVTYSIDKANSDGDATIDPATGVLAPVKVGSVSVIATKAGDKDYNDVIGAPFVITITQAESVGEPNYTKITTSGKKLKDAALTADGSTLDPNVGTLEWVDDNGNVLPDDTKVVANTIYKWRFTPADSNYTTLSGAVELYHHVPGGVFYYSYYTIKATAGDGGAVSPSGDVRVREGRDQTFTITPDEDHVIADVKIDGKSIGAVESYTFENVGKAHTIEVSFAKAGDITEADRFADIADGSYYEDAVDWAVKSGITKGTDNTHFSPNGICTRAQAVTFLWRAAGSPEPESDVMPFTDVTADSYYYNAVLWAVENGITKGTDDTVFSPDMTCSRAQIVTFLWRFEKSPSVGTVNPFADVKSDAYYADAVLWAVSEDITNGTSDTEFSPDADCTRAQIVTFLWRCKK